MADVVGGDAIQTVASLDHGSKSIATSATQLIVASTPAKKGVAVAADEFNTETVWIGNSDVTVGETADATDGFPLTPGSTLTLSIDDVNKIYGRVATTAQRVYWIVL